MKKTYLALIILNLFCYGIDEKRSMQSIEKEIMETMISKEERINTEENININKEKEIIDINKNVNKEIIKIDKNEEIKINIEKLKKDIEELNKDIKKIKEQNNKIEENKIEEVKKENKIEEVKNDIVENQIKEKEFLGMKIGEWEIEKEEIKKWLSEEKKEYIVIPIIDKREYKKDEKELKKYGLSRKRAETAIKIIKEKNKENEIYIGKEIEIRENQRGIKIKIKE